MIHLFMFFTSSGYLFHPYHFQHPLLHHFSTPGWNRTFSTNPSNHNRLLVPPDCLHGSLDWTGLITLIGLFFSLFCPYFLWSIKLTTRQFSTTLWREEEFSLWLQFILLMTFMIQPNAAHCNELCSKTDGQCTQLDVEIQHHLVTGIDLQMRWQMRCRQNTGKPNYTHHRHLLLLLSPKADTHFTVPRRVEGWVDLVGWLHTEMVYPSTDGHPSWY